MLILRGEIAKGNLGTAICKIGAGQKLCRLAATDARVAAGAEFRAQYQVLEKFDSFKYLSDVL